MAPSRFSLATRRLSFVLALGRWYVTPKACEDARRVAVRALAQDARLAMRLGFARGC